MFWVILGNVLVPFKLQFPLCKMGVLLPAPKEFRKDLIRSLYQAHVSIQVSVP